MKFEVTKDLLEEMAWCIVDNDLTGEEACEYVMATVTGSDKELYESKPDIILNKE